MLLPSSDVRIVSFVIGSKAGDVVGFGEGGGDIFASEGVKSDDHLEFVRDSMLLGAGCGSISVIVAEQYDVKRSIAVAPAAKASECGPLSIGFLVMMISRLSSLGFCFICFGCIKFKHGLFVLLV